MKEPTSNVPSRRQFLKTSSQIAATTALAGAVIPKVHAENLWEISESALTAVHTASKKIVTAMTRAMGPVSVAAVQLNGKGVNQVVMHYHLHLIPRAEDGEALTLTAWEMIPGDMDVINRTGAAIAAAIENDQDQKESK